MKANHSKTMMIRIQADLMLLFMALLMFVNFILPSMLAVVNSHEKAPARDLICAQLLPDSPPGLRLDSDILLAVEVGEKGAPDLDDNPYPKLAKWNGTPAVRTIAIDATEVSGGELKLLVALTTLESPQQLKPIRLVVYRDADMHAVAEEIKEGQIDPSRPIIELNAENGFRASIVIPPAFLEKSQ